jgi:hypothetical protein
MKPSLVFAICFLCLNISSFASEDWGMKGHRATGEIAEKHLNKKAKRALKKLLDGESLAFVSTYGDEIKSDDRYRSYGPWHYVNFPFDSTYETHPKSEKGDLIAGIQTCISVLKNETASREERVFHLKMLVHFIGDLHQPLHVGMAADRGGNQFQVLWFDEGTNLHSVWDTKMIESYNMSFSELASNTTQLSEAQLQIIQQGDVLDWMRESRELCTEIYADTKTGENLGYQYMYKYVNVARFQMQKGGIRLAVLLNELFG